MATGTVIVKPNVRSNILTNLPSLVNPTDTVGEIELVAITYKHANGSMSSTPVNIGFYKNGYLRENAFGLTGNIDRQTGVIDIVATGNDVYELTFAIGSVNLNNPIRSEPVNPETDKFNKLESILDRIDDMLASRSEGNRGSAAAHEDLLYRDINDFVNTYDESPLEFVRNLRRKMKV